ncbi:glycosyltransferase family 2 protein [Aquipseudomonas ullengensis]|uniref:Glycosyltransferase n=1 Tax=Aquipseudomonas ullengensis TaxID=2759166 RepID=A0A7W4LPD4_9GAMM|nr:glycosyltransferase family 2 protein [Pseudomonas ullengensis]MBB2496858.1 glycosyltransferase [Pseudomonas ullengensis]
MSVSLSVIMIVKNDRLRFRRALSSVLAQKTAELEIIVIDGGSTDSTREEIAAHKDQLHYWESGLDKGIADAFNRGIAQARGEFIATLNSDDTWEPDTLRLVQEAQQQNPQASVLCGAVRYLDPDSGYSYVRYPNPAALKFRMWVFHPSLFVSRAAYARVGGYEPQYSHAMDSEWCHRALARGEKFEVIPAVLANMSLGGLSDRDFVISLRQYRDSVMRNGLCGPVEAWTYYLLFLGLKKAMLAPLMQPVKKLRDRLIRHS